MPALMGLKLCHTSHIYTVSSYSTTVMEQGMAGDDFMMRNIIGHQLLNITYTAISHVK
jgi:hypothetical protein